MEWRCLWGDPACTRATLCDRCLRYEIAQRTPQARNIGTGWAERICHDELKRKQWAEVDAARATEIAARLVLHLADDPRVNDALAREALLGAEAWWTKRPDMYRR